MGGGPSPSRAAMATLQPEHIVFYPIAFVTAFVVLAEVYHQADQGTADSRWARLAA
jgi:hypothetical protein